MSATVEIMPGFESLVLDSQRVFREVLACMSFPGRVRRLDRLPPAPVGLDPAQAALVLTLADVDTAVWLDDAARTPAAEAHLRFHCGAPLVDDPAAAAFAIVGDAASMPTLDRFDPGSDQYPDRSATVIVALPALNGGPPVRLTGPGIERQVVVSPGGLPGWFWDAWRLNRELFPTGVDVVLTAGADILGLPRSVRAEE